MRRQTKRRRRKAEAQRRSGGFSRGWQESTRLGTGERALGIGLAIYVSAHRLKPVLLAGEALEVGHLALHLFACGVRSGADALDAQLEFVGVGGARQSFVEGDELFGVQVEERLIEGLHAVLAGAGGDGVVNQARLVRVDDAIADVGGAD